MNKQREDRLLRVTRITNLMEYRNRRVVYDMPKRRALNIASYERQDIDRVIEGLGKYIDEKR